MEIIGSHDNGIVEDKLDCKLIIKNGILGVYAYGATNYQKLNQPQNEKKWNYREVNWKENKPVEITKMSEKGMEWVWKYTHVIEYVTKNNLTQRIFINPNRRQRFWLKQNNKQLLYQKFTTIEYFVGLVIAFLLNVAVSAFWGLISDDKTAAIINNNPTTIKHDLPNLEIQEDSIIQTENKKSTIMQSSQDLKFHQGDSLSQGIIKHE